MIGGFVTFVILNRLWHHKLRGWMIAIALLAGWGVNGVLLRIFHTGWASWVLW